MKWYVVHTFAAQESKIRETIERGIKNTALEDKIGRMLIPTQKTYHIKDGKKTEREKKIFNSYIIIEAELTQEVFNYILRVPGVTNFLGTGKKAVPLSESEVNRLLGIADRDKSDVASYDFFPGDLVKISSGPFMDFEGLVDSFDKDSKKMIVNVTVFGRVTPVEVSVDQIEIIK
jgi:transcriptional antiterminator NusG